MTLDLKKERSYSCSNCKSKFNLRVTEFGDKINNTKILFCPLCEMEI